MILMVHAAINDSVRAGLVVYSIYWQSMGRANSTPNATDAASESANAKSPTQPAAIVTGKEREIRFRFQPVLQLT